MQLDWKLTRSGPFPEGIQNAIVNLHAALVIQEAEASQDSIEERMPPSNHAPTPTTPTTAHTMFNWATEVDSLFGPVIRPNDNVTPHAHTPTTL